MDKENDQRVKVKTRTLECAQALQKERDRLHCAVQALDTFYQRVRVTHYPEALPIPADEVFTLDPLSWVHSGTPKVDTPPPPPPPPLAPPPLPPCSYEREWLELESERSLLEYRRLHALYYTYLGRGEEGLIDLWKAIGGGLYWRSKLRPSQLTLLLSREHTSTSLRFRCRKEGNMLMLGGADGILSSSDDVTLPVANEKRGAGLAASPVTNSTPTLASEWSTFCSYVLPRLPNLQHLVLIDFPFWPFDFKVLDKTSYSFPELKYVRFSPVKCTPEEVVEFVKRLPTLAKNGDGLWVDESFLKVSAANHMSKKAMLEQTKERVTVLSRREQLTI